MNPSTQAHPRPVAESTDDQLMEEARLYVQRLRALYVHAAVCAASLVLIFAVNLAVNLAAGITSEWWAWWSVWALVGWTLGLMTHGLVVRLSRLSSRTSKWEQHQIDKILGDHVPAA